MQGASLKGEWTARVPRQTSPQPGLSEFAWEAVLGTKPASQAVVKEEPRAHVSSRQSHPRPSAQSPEDMWQQQIANPPQL